MEKKTGVSESAARLWKAGACCAGYIGLIWLACLAFVRLLPRIGGLFIEDEGILRFLTSLSRARVLPGLWAPLSVCALLFLLLFLRERRQKARGLEPKKALPVWFPLTLGLSFVPALVPAIYFSRLNLVPVRVIINLVKKLG